MLDQLDGNNLIAGEGSRKGSCSFVARDPAENRDLAPEFFEATSEEIDAAGSAARDAFDHLNGSSQARRATFLEAIAHELSIIGPSAITRAQHETGLPAPRLQGELVRTQGQLQMFAELIKDGSWVDARIDHGNPQRSPLPKPDLRRMLVPLGPIAVFGASNFPFAFSVAGGDTASAFAAGCTVIFKAHPAHPGVSELVGKAISIAAARTQMPKGIFSLVHGSAGVGERLVQHQNIEAVAFTGSFAGGMSVLTAAGRRERPIPVFAEMGSTNPVIFLPGALRQSAGSLASGYVGSLTLGVGQFCTNPGIVLGLGGEFARFCEDVSARLTNSAPGVMLTSGILKNYTSATEELARRLGLDLVGDAGSAPHLFRVSAETFKRDAKLREEVFGPSAIAVMCESEQELMECIECLPGQLTATLHASGDDMELATRVLPLITSKVGRVVWNGFPTGVEVSPAIQHGGPFPATTDSRSTSVGTAAIYRFVRPVCYQDVPDDLLPLALRESNPTGIRRFVDGKLV